MCSKILYSNYKLFCVRGGEKMTQAKFNLYFRDGRWSEHFDTRVYPPRDTKVESFLAGVMELLCGEFRYASEDIPSQAFLETLVAGKDAKLGSERFFADTFGFNRLSCGSVGLSFDMFLLDE